MRVFWSVMLSLTLAATTAFAMAGGEKPDKPDRSDPSLPSSSAEAEASGPRHEAEETYALAYEDMAKAKKDLEAGKAKNAEKKFKKALERVERATELDANYHEAWNLVGYCARKLGDYPKAFAAYDKCLSIKPGYAPAREYLGEAYLEKGDPKKAREQLALLGRLDAPEETKTLQAALVAYETAHPEAKEPAAAPEPAATPAATDTTAKSGQ